MCTKNVKKFKIMINLVDISALNDYDVYIDIVEHCDDGSISIYKILEKFWNNVIMIKTTMLWNL